MSTREARILSPKTAYLDEIKTHFYGDQEIATVIFRIDHMNYRRYPGLLIKQVFDCGHLNSLFELAVTDGNHGYLSLNDNKCLYRLDGILKEIHKQAKIWIRLFEN